MAILTLGRFLESQVQYDCNDNPDDADELGDGQTGEGMVHSTENISPVSIAPEIFYKEADDRVIEYVHGENLAGEFFLPVKEDEYDEV